MASRASGRAAGAGSVPLVGGGRRSASPKPGETERAAGQRSEFERALGPDVAAGQVPHAVILPGCWQGARSLGAWTLCGCTVAPAFEFAGFELAPTGWQPGRRDRPE